MASPSRSDEREEERRHHVRTLAIASTASASAAVLTSQLWIRGTWIAAALTPVIVTLVSELLYRPTERIASKLTSERPSLSARASDSARADDPAPADPGEEAAPARAAPAEPVRVYRSSSVPPRRRKIAVGAVLGTAALALAIAVVALTVPELIAGGAIGKGGESTTFFGKKNKKSATPKDKNEPAPTTETTEEPETETEDTSTTEEPAAPEETTTTAPAGQSPTETTPVPPPTQP